MVWRFRSCPWLCVWCLGGVELQAMPLVVWMVAGCRGWCLGGVELQAMPLVVWVGGLVSWRVPR